MTYRNWTLILTFFALFLTSLISCNDNQNKQLLEISKKKNIKEQACNVNKSAKLFLDFWGQMLEDEFYCVRAELMKSNKIAYNPIQNEFYYIINGDSLMIEPRFSKKKLLKVILNVPAFKSYESYESINNGVTFPQETVSKKSINIIQGYMLSKYGNPIKNKTKDESFLGILQGHNETFKWADNTKFIVLTKSLSPVYKSYQVNQSNGITTTKYKIFRYEVDKMTLEYIDSDLEKSLNKENDKDEKIKKSKENSELKNL